jgi:lysophospholipid acyltransferase (LPLAT)-like uncharacterized protein
MESENNPAQVPKKIAWMSRAKTTARKMAARCMGLALKRWVSTSDIRVTDYENNCDASLREFHGPVIYVLWHEYILLPTLYTGGCDMTLLIGTHRDADLLGEIADSFGFKTVRGSSTKGGIRAILKYTREHRDTSLVISPDGPRGPRRVLSPGCIQLASLLQMPIVAAGFGFDRPYRYPSWDRFAVPRLGSRGRLILSPRISIPRKLSESQLENTRVRVESILNQVSAEAENWAFDGVPRERERGMLSVPHASEERSNSLGLIS